MAEFSILELEEEHTAAVRRTVPRSELTGFFDTAFVTVLEALQRAGRQPAGAPFARYRGDPTDVVDVEAGFPVTEPLADTDELVAGTLPAGRAVEAVHVGSYDDLRSTYDRIWAWAAEHHLELGTEMWERYESGPASDPDPATWRTRILWPLARPKVEAG